MSEEALAFKFVVQKRGQKEKETGYAQTYLQPRYGNGVFGNVSLSAGQH